MANCSKCGRKLAGFTFGKQTNLCKWCVQHEAAQRGELPEDDIQPVMAAPWEQSTTDTMFLTQLFVLMNVLVFVAMAISGVSVFEPTSSELIRWGSNYGPLTLGGQPWRLLSCVFVHIGFIHLALNMWCLWSLGELAEKLYGHIAFLLVYVTTGIAASLASVWWRPGGVSAGASGAIFGVAGALIASYYLGEFSLPQVAVKASLRSVVTFAGYNLLFGAMRGRTDNAAHIGGLICGLALGAVIAKAAPDRESWGSRVMIGVLGLALVCGSVVWLQKAKGFDVHVQNGETAMDNGEYDLAIREFQQAVATRPKDISAKLDLARAYYMKNQFPQAISELQSALAIDPNNEEIAFRMGMTYFGDHQPAKAKESFAQLVARNPKSAYGHYGMGMMAANDENHQVAIDEYSRAVELDQDFTGTYYLIALSQMQLKRFDEAIASLEKARRIAGDDPDIELALADAYSAKGMSKEAQEAKTKAEQLKAGGANEGDSE